MCLVSGWWACVSGFVETELGRWMQEVCGTSGLVVIVGDAAREGDGPAAVLRGQGGVGSGHTSVMCHEVEQAAGAVAWANAVSGRLVRPR